jgi:ubiquinone/menaquinone biosynthesis C-methylase UbiE
MNYTRIAENYNLVEGQDPTLRIIGYPNLIRFLEPLKGKEILDYGCGTGIFARELRDKGARVTGVDVSRGMIDMAKKASPEGISYSRVKSGDLSRFRDQSFDHATSTFVLCAIPQKAMIRTILSEIHRVLTDHGTFIMMNTNWEESNGCEFINHRLELCENLVSGCRIRVISKSDPEVFFEDYFRSKKEYLQMMQDAGFKIEGMTEPIAPADETPWLDERISPPYFLIAGRKVS